MKLLIAHISFVPLSQKKLTSEEFKGKPIELAEFKLKENVHYIRSKKRYHVNLIFDNFVFDANGRILGGKIGKDKEAKLPKHDELGFHKDVNKLSPFVDFLWDGEGQFILIERNTSVFEDYEYVFNSIQSHLGKLLEPYEWGVFVEPITEKRDFWDAYKKFSYVYEVSFELHMPNIFGNLQKELSESLKDLNKSFNATSVSQTLLNPEGKLNFNVNDSMIEKLLNWIANGAGCWGIIGKVSEEAKKEKVTSKKSATIKTEDIDIELKNYSAEEVHKIISKIRPKIAAMRVPEPTQKSKKKPSKKKSSKEKHL